MDTSILIAKFMGPVILAASLSMFINRDQVTRIFEDFTNSPGMIFLAGVMTLLMGLTLVIFHNKWEANWTLIITIFGWIGIAGGLMRMMFPMAAIDMGKTDDPAQGRAGGYWRDQCAARGVPDLQGIYRLNFLEKNERKQSNYQGRKRRNGEGNRT